MGSLAAIGIVKGKPFNPDARMKKILTDAAAIGTAAARTLDWRPRPAEGFYYYPNSAWMEPLFVGGYNFETPPPEVSADGTITVNPPTGARTLNCAHGLFLLRHLHHPSDVHATDRHRLAVPWRVRGLQRRILRRRARPTR